MPFIPNIWDTEAAIVEDEYKDKVGKLIRMSGMTGSEALKLYITIPTGYENWRPRYKPYFSYRFLITREINVLQIECHDTSPPRKGERILFLFEDNKAVHLQINKADAPSDGDYRKNTLLLSDYDLMLFAAYKLEAVEITDSSIGKVCRYEFIDESNEQYNSAWEGQELSKMIGERIVEVRKWIREDARKH